MPHSRTVVAQPADGVMVHLTAAQAEHLRLLAEDEVIRLRMRLDTWRALREADRDGLTAADLALLHPRLNLSPEVAAVLARAAQ